jgi:hypothetical protein
MNNKLQKFSYIAFNNDEGYTETGFKAKSRELLDEELGNAIIQTAKSKHKYENKEAQKIFNVTNAMGKYTGIDISPIYEFIVRVESFTDNLKNNFKKVDLQFTNDQTI